MSEFLPPLVLTIVFSGFEALRFENQRWWRARQRGLRGSSALAGEAVDWTFLLATFFKYTFLAHFAWEFGWKPAVGLFLISWVASFIYAAASTAIIGGDRVGVWMAATVALWPVMAALAYWHFLFPPT